MQNGDAIRFRTTGYEIADVRNPNPPAEWTGHLIGGPNETHVVLWCERERREAGPVLVALSNVLENMGPSTPKVPRSGTAKPARTAKPTRKRC